jgi:uncharacterized protein (TIGR02145 family)
MKILFLSLNFSILTYSIFSQVKIGTNPITIDSSALVEMESASKGVLIPRMSSASRDAIVQPANGLLIYNTINNSFEVYKSLCNCWVSIYDGGNSPAYNIANSAPEAKNLFLSGQYIVGKTVTVNYTYFDGQLDPEGITNIQWQISSTNSGININNIPGANFTSYSPIASNAGYYIRAVITPRASTGLLNGVETPTEWVLIDLSTIPTANNLMINGVPKQGSTLSAEYIFDGGNGIEDTTQTGTQFVWQIASSNFGQNINNAPLYDSLNYSDSYIPKSNLIGKYIRVAVKAKDSYGLQTSNYVYSNWVGPITVAIESIPVVSNVKYSTAPAIGITLSGSYSYFDCNFDPEGASTYQWYRADDSIGTNQSAISGATTLNYSPILNDVNKYIGLGVKPLAQTGNINYGSEVIYYNPNSTLPKAVFTFTNSTHKQLPFFSANKLMNFQENAIQVEVNVTSAGGLSASSTTINGYSFSGNFALIPTGTNWITLIPTGTQTAYNSSGDNFTITGIASTTETKTITIYNTKKGADFTTHYNGWVSGVNATPNATIYTVGETFDNVSECTSNLISTSACPAGNTVTGSSGFSYPTVSINGQCWMAKNLREIPSNFSTLTATSFSANLDYGGWGYYNISTPDGSAGYATSEQVTDYGMLYQWKAAMNNATNERAQGACPTGWHIPSDCEWKFLEHGLGLTIAQINLTGGWGRNGTNISYKMRSQGVNANNSSGFSVVLGGFRNSSGIGSFSGAGVSGDTWFYSSNKSGSDNIYRIFSMAAGGSVSNSISRYLDNSTHIGGSIRCLRD